MINVEQYIELKAKGLITLAKVGNAYVVVMDRFDVNTGQKAQPEIQSLDIQVYKDNIVKLQNVILQIEALIKDCVALGE